MSLIVVATALPARLASVSYQEIAAHWTIAANLLAGSLIGAWLGATWAIALGANHFIDLGSLTSLPTVIHVAAATLAGAGIGVVAALMGVAGGELLIPTIILLFAVDIIIAGSLSLLVSLPTMLVAFARYSRDQSFTVLRENTGFVLTWPPDRLPEPSSAGCFSASFPHSC